MSKKDRKVLRLPKYVKKFQVHKINKENKFFFWILNIKAQIMPILTNKNLDSLVPSKFFINRLGYTMVRNKREKAEKRYKRRQRIWQRLVFPYVDWRNKRYKKYKLPRWKRPITAIIKIFCRAKITLIRNLIYKNVGGNKSCLSRLDYYKIGRIIYRFKYNYFLLNLNFFWFYLKQYSLTGRHLFKQVNQKLAIMSSKRVRNRKWRFNYQGPFNRMYCWNTGMPFYNYRWWEKGQFKWLSVKIAWWKNFKLRFYGRYPFLFNRGLTYLKKLFFKWTTKLNQDLEKCYTPKSLFLTKYIFFTNYLGGSVLWRSPIKPVKHSYYYDLQLFTPSYLKQRNVFYITLPGGWWENPVQKIEERVQQKAILAPIWIPVEEEGYGDEPTRMYSTIFSQKTSFLFNLERNLLAKPKIFFRYLHTVTKKKRFFWNNDYVLFRKLNQDKPIAQQAFVTRNKRLQKHILNSYYRRQTQYLNFFISSNNKDFWSPFRLYKRRNVALINFNLLLNRKSNTIKVYSNSQISRLKRLKTIQQILRSNKKQQIFKKPNSYESNKKALTGWNIKKLFLNKNDKVLKLIKLHSGAKSSVGFLCFILLEGSALIIIIRARIIPLVSLIFWLFFCKLIKVNDKIAKKFSLVSPFDTLLTPFFLIKYLKIYETFITKTRLAIKTFWVNIKFRKFFPSFSQKNWVFYSYFINKTGNILMAVDYPQLILYYRPFRRFIKNFLYNSSFNYFSYDKRYLSNTYALFRTRLYQYLTVLY